jgi:hypothetical protein
MVKQKAMAALPPVPKPAGEKQGRQLLSQDSVVSPGQDVTGGLKGRITRRLQVWSVQQPSRSRVTVNERAE